MAFTMQIENVFVIEGRGVVVAGRIRSGVVKKGDALHIIGSGEPIPVQVLGVEMFEFSVPFQASAGEDAGVLLSGISESQVKVGDTLTDSTKPATATESSQPGDPRLLPNRSAADGDDRAGVRSNGMSEFQAEMSEILTGTPVSATASEPSQRDGPRLYPNRFAADFRFEALQRPACRCLDVQYGQEDWQELSLHTEPQDADSPAWHRLLDLIDEATVRGHEEFAPGRVLDPKDWMQVVTLPPTIAKLKSVKRLILYGSSLVRLPPQLGEMSSLEEFDPYTSYRLHWFPYEIRRCKNLRSSRVSTRALYGNYKYRPPFPLLPQLSPTTMPEHCSVCNGPFGDSQPLQRWISLRVATDVLPLLVYACSYECLDMLPNPPKGYIARPHQGGLDLEQPRSY